MALFNIFKLHRSASLTSFVPNFHNKRKLYIIGAWCSFVAFFLQIYIPKIFSFLVGYNVPTSSCLIFSFLGFGLGVNLVLWKRFCNINILLSCIAIICFLSGAVLSVSTHYYILWFLVTVVFFPIGSLLAIAFKMLNTYLFYIVDFFGALLGLAIGIFLLPVLLIETQYIILICLTAILSLLFSNGRFFFVLNLFMCCLSLSTLYLQIKTDKFNLIKYSANIKSSQFDFANGFKNLKKGTHTLLHTRWSYSKRVDVLKTNSDNFLGEIQLYYDNYLFSPVVKKQNNSYGFYNIEFFSMFKNRINSALVIGPGGGRDLFHVWKTGAKFVKGVEMNDATVSLMLNELSKYSGKIYERSNVVTAEGRKFLNETEDTFDLIVGAHINREHVSHRDFFEKDFLRTKEGLKAGINRLKKNGYLIFYEHLYYPNDTSIASVLVTLTNFLQSMKKSSRQHIFVLREEKKGPLSKIKGPSGLLVFKKSPLNQNDLSMVKSFIREHKDWVVTFFDKASFNRIIPMDLEEKFIKNTIMQNGNLFSETSNNTTQQFRILSDSSPFMFFKHEKKGFIKVILLILASILILLAFNLYYGLNLIRKSSQTKNLVDLLSYSLLLSIFSGLFYGMTEVFFIELFSLSFHNQVFLIGTVLGAMLSGGIIASWISSKLTPKQAQLILFLFIGYLPVGLLIGDNGGISQTVTFLKFPFVFLSIGMVTLISSVLFPKMLSIIQRNSQQSVPFIYGCNIIAMNCGLFLSLCLYIYFGIAKTGFALIIVFMAFFVASILWLRKLSPFEATL